MRGNSGTRRAKDMSWAKWATNKRGSGVFNHDDASVLWIRFDSSVLSLSIEYMASMLKQRA
jgi:hypothetical protein